MRQHSKYCAQFWVAQCTRYTELLKHTENSNKTGEGTGKKEGAAVGTGVLQSREGGCNQLGISLISQVTSDRTQGNSPKLCQGRLRLDMRKNFFMEGVASHWDRLLRDAEVPLNLGGIQEICGLCTYGHGLLMGLCSLILIV